MNYNRDVLLEDLRRNVVKITIDGFGDVRCTLKLDHFPNNLHENIIKIDDEYHRENKTSIKCYSFSHKGWITFDISRVAYAEDCSDRF